MKQFSHNIDEKKIHDLENVKLKLKMISKNSKSSKVSVDDYISNILGSGLQITRPSNFNRTESQSAQNLQNDKNRRLNGGECNHSTSNISSTFSSLKDSTIESDFYQNLPFVYREIINRVKLPTGDLDTQQIYTIFLSSGLSRDILGLIWSAINRTLPGKLTILELSVGLAMIALNQKQSFKNGSISTGSVITWDYVISSGEFPIPQLSIDILPNGSELANICPISQNTTSTVSSSQVLDVADNWADFSSFTPNECQIDTVNIPVTTIELPKNDLNPINRPLDIQKQINSQFSSWQNDIKLENSIVDTGRVDQHEEFNVSISENTPNSVDSVNKINKPIKFTIDSDFGDFQNFTSDQFSVSNVQEKNSIPKALITDRYQIFHSEASDPYNNLVDQWLRCLNQCKKIISDTVYVLNRISDPFIKVDVFNCEKGILLLTGIIEVYRVTRNIKLSISKTNILTSSKSLIEVLTDIERHWNNFMLLLPDEMQIDVQTRLSKGIKNSNFKPCVDDVSAAECCGVCLCVLDPSEGFLSHGLRRYHCPCANLWVNTLDLTLPGLHLPGSVL